MGTYIDRLSIGANPGNRSTVQVLEAWMVWAAYGLTRGHGKLVLGFISSLARALHRQTGPAGGPMVRRHDGHLFGSPVEFQCVADCQ